MAEKLLGSLNSPARASITLITLAFFKSICTNKITNEITNEIAVFIYERVGSHSDLFVFKFNNFQWNS